MWRVGALCDGCQENPGDCQSCDTRQDPVSSCDKIQHLYSCMPGDTLHPKFWAADNPTQVHCHPIPRMPFLSSLLKLCAPAGAVAQPSPAHPYSQPTQVPMGAKKNALNLGNVRLLFFKDCFSYLEGPWDCTWIILFFFSPFLKKEYHWCLEWDLIESVDCSGLMEILKIIYFESQSDREASIHWPMAQMIFMPMAGPSQEPGTSSGSPAWW